HPESDQGGPQLAGGLAWLDVVEPRVLNLAPKLAGGKPTLLFLTNFSAVATLRDLQRRFPMDAVLVAPGFANEFPGRDVFDRALHSRPRFDGFVLSRIAERTIPLDVQYEILHRVADDGAGLTVIDLFDHSDTLNPEFLGLKPTEKGNNLLPGIPYGALRQVDLAQQTRFAAFNYWNTGGVIRTEPVEKPLPAFRVDISPFGKGRVVWVSTNSHWERYWGGRTLLPHVQQNRSQWIDDDYAYSHTAKAILRSLGRVPAAQIVSVAPEGKADRDTVPVVKLACPGGTSFEGTLRWQLRDTWAVVAQQGKAKLSLPAAGGEIALDQAELRDAGRCFLDLWVENAAGETVDWGSGWFDVDRGVAALVITPKHPRGTPRGQPLEGAVTVAGAPAGSSLRLSLIDRYDREVVRSTTPIAAGPVNWRMPTDGLDGQIWRLHADVVAGDGSLVARSWRTLTSPHTRATRGGWAPLMTTSTLDCPEAAARREFLRRLGFLTNRPYGPGNAIEAEAAAWNDIQQFPFVHSVTAATDDYKTDHLTDWEDPAVREDIDQAHRLLVRELSPFGLRGFNQTDDSAAATVLPLGPYTTIAFHQWLRQQYGDLAGVCRAWSWTPTAQAVPDGELPADPYVALEFHAWLKAKYGDLQGVAKAWKLPTEGFGWLHTFGTIQSEWLRKLKAEGNELPANDARDFVGSRDRTAAPNPFGAIGQASIKQQYDAGNTAPWIDAQHFLEQRWVENLSWAQTAAQAVSPELAVGTDAGYYASVMADVFGRLSYVAPYYDDRAVKVAVDRGRMRRDGDYGACLGAYGEKPANMSGRRSQIWDVLFAGGNSFYYWAFGDGIREDLTLSDKHARYQCEVVEELSGGLGELFTGARRIFDPIAILDSETSSLCDQLERKGQPVTSQANSIAAFQFAFEDLGLNPHTVTGEELAGGWLAANAIKLLALPGANSLSDGEIAAVREFVQGGGVVVADVRPGGRLPNGNVRDGAALDDLFGVKSDPQGKAPRVRGKLSATVGGAALDFGEALADPRVQPAGAQAAGSLGGAPALFANGAGAGRAFLFNASFSSYATYRNEGGAIWRPWHAVMHDVVTAAGLKPAFTWTSGGQETPGFELSPFRHGAGYLLGVEELGCGDFVGARRAVELALPGTFHVYEMRAGRYLGKLSVLKDGLPRSGHRAYALLPYAVQAVTLRAAESRVAPGGTLRLSADLTVASTAGRAPHVVRIEALGPDGKPFYPFRRVLRMPGRGPLAASFTVAYNDPPGEWRFVATDLVSGKTAEARVTVGGGGR
ncbi:MAG: hypothetical protein HYU66_11240, partial [Armatimonadetes bacterium]|nr:hypothetical protein [Armatimonadota bacterium]